MAHTHKKKPGKPGRPESTVSAKREAERLRRDDGERLNAALQLLGLSQAEAARRSGVRQGWLNDIANGHRPIGREDLRRLGRAGIPPDYVLGLTDTLVSPGESRTRAHIEQDLARAVERELARLHPPTVPEVSTKYKWVVSGDRAFRAAVDACAGVAERLLADERTRADIRADGAILRAAIDALLALPVGAVDVTLERKLVALQEPLHSLDERLAGLPQRAGAPILLTPIESSEDGRVTARRTKAGRRKLPLA